MVRNHLPEYVAHAFVRQYYLILHRSPQNIHRFYKEHSLQSWPDPDGFVTPVTSLSGISDRVMSSDYKYCSADVKTMDAQDSLEGGIIVSVTGCLAGKDNVKEEFMQTFFLAKQERGYYILNDILRFVNVCETQTTSAANTDDENDQDDQPSPAQNFDSKAAVENEKVEEAMENSDSKDTLANDAVPIPFDSGERVVSPETNAKEKSAFAPAKKSKAPSAVSPAKTPRVPSVVTLVSNVTLKISYASMLAKEAPVTSSPATKASAPLQNGSPQTSSLSVTVYNPCTSTSKVAAKSPTGGEGLLNPSPYTEARGIYIGGLPNNITKQGVVDIVKSFGPVRRYSDAVQIRRHEDGFCCGFVEFESADAARRAVEAHRVTFGKKEAYILYKRSSYNRGSDGRARSPAGHRNGSSMVPYDEYYYSNDHNRGLAGAPLIAGKGRAAGIGRSKYALVAIP